jgi:hypothetical protein
MRDLFTPFRHGRLPSMKNKDRDDSKERAMIDLLLWVDLAAVVVLFVVMVAGLYYWSHYAPMFPPDGAGGPSTEEIIPW